MDCVPYSCHGHVWLSFFHSASTGRAPLTGPMLNRIVLCELWGLNLHTATFVGRPSSYLINNLDFLKHILFSLCHSEKKVLIDMCQVQAKCELYLHPPPLISQKPWGWNRSCQPKVLKFLLDCSFYLFCSWMSFPAKVMEIQPVYGGKEFICMKTH